MVLIVSLSFTCSYAWLSFWRVVSWRPFCGEDALNPLRTLDLSWLCAAEEGKPGAAQPELKADAGQDTIARLDKLRHSQGPLSVAQIRSNLQKTMQADAAVFRTQVLLPLLCSPFNNTQLAGF